MNCICVIKVDKLDQFNKKIFLGAGEIAHLMRCLLHSHEYLSLIHSTHIKWGMAVCISNPSAGETELG